MTTVGIEGDGLEGQKHIHTARLFIVCMELMN